MNRNRIRAIQPAGVDEGLAGRQDCRAYWIEARWGSESARARCGSKRVKKLGHVDVVSDSERRKTGAAAIVPVAMSTTSDRRAAASMRIELASGISIEASQDIDADVLCDLLRHAIDVCRR